MKRIVFVLMALCALTAQAKQYSYRTVEGDPIKARIYTLDNGLTVYLSQNAEKPEIQTFIAVRAGSQNDPLESTGLAHYQEHIMFKGTQSYGTTNYEAEIPNLNAIDSLYEVYGSTTDAEQRKAIYHLIDSFSYANSKIAIANEFDKLMSAIGATGVNAFTSEEMTCYHEVIPAGELTRWAMIEADRFQHLVVRGFHTELETVYEEFNMYSTMDQDKVLLAIDQMLFPNIPYRQHTVLGTQEDLKNPSLKNIKQFYQTYYRPNNVAVCLAGDFDFDHAIAVVDKYFGAWEPREIPAFVKPEQPDLTTPKDTIVYGQEASQLWLAWKMPDARDEDYLALEAMSSILYNGKCGLIDVDIDQKQTLLGGANFLRGGNDYSTFFMLGLPKDKQSLTEVRKILLAEVEKLKRGEFSEELLQSILRNEKRNDLIGQQNNYNRTISFVEAHIYQIPYEKIVNRLDRLEQLTKDDIVRVANKYLGDNYACVQKIQSTKGVNPTKVDKPEITPIEMNRDSTSKFCADLLAMEPEKLEPQFLDFDKDLSRSVLPNGVELLYVQNKDNELAHLSFTIGKGSDQDPVLDIATALLSYLGTEEYSTEQYQTKLYSLAAEAWAYASDNELEFGVYGLQETMPEALKLMESWVLTAVPEQTVLQEIIKDQVKAHNDAKADQQSCFGFLINYGVYGPQAIQKKILTPKQLKQLKAQDVLNSLRALLPAIERVEYFGPMAEEDVKKWLTTSNLMALADASKKEPAKRFETQVVTTPEVWVAPYNANNSFLYAYANWGEIYTPQEEAIVQLYNEYFDGSMGSIVFQEMRESRALCYGASAAYVLPDYAGETNNFFTYILSQNDKINDCITAFDTICNNLPLSQMAFDNAKTALLKRIEKRRYIRMAPINSYLAYRDKGWDHDYWQDIYNEVQKLTLDDVVAFQKAHVANRTYRYLILGNPKDLDMKFLKTRGTVKNLKLKDIFIY